MLLSISLKTPRLNSYIGNVMMISFFITNSAIYSFDNFSSAVQYYCFGIFGAYFFTVFVDGNWLLSGLVNEVAGLAFWGLNKKIAGASMITMIETHIVLGFLLLLTGWWVQFIKRKLFF